MSSTLELKNIFEYELKRKLSLKSKRNTSEPLDLVNAFRFNDTFNSGSVNIEQWIRTFDKIGLTGFTNKDMSSLFNYYDIHRNGAINYKDFSFGLFNQGVIGNEEQNAYPQDRPMNKRFQPEDDQLSRIYQTKDMILNQQQQHLRQANTPINQQQFGNQSMTPLQPLTSQYLPQQTPQMSSHSTRTPVQDDVKGYFKYLIDLISQKIHVNNGIGYFLFASRLKQSEEKFTKVISFDNYIRCLAEMQIEIHPKEARDLFGMLDMSDKHCISTLELLRLLQRPLSDFRRSTIINQFVQMDTNRRGQIEIRDLKSLFNAREHPDTKSGRRSETEVYQEFLFTLETFITMKDISIITIDDFIEYYTIMSGGIDNDSYFEMLMNSVWLRQGYPGLQSNLMPQDRFRDQYDILPKQGSQLSTPLNSNYTQPNQFRYNPITNIYVTPENKEYQGMGGNSGKRDIYLNNIPIDEYSQQKNNDFVTQCILKLRNLLISRGSKGIFGLQKILKMYDRNGTKQIHISDFELLCQAFKLSLTPEEINAIFSILDTDHTAIIKYNDLINLLTGEINDSRTHMILKAFNSLDKNRSNLVDKNDMKLQFNSSRHPDVLSRKKTANEIQGELLDNLDAFCLYNDLPMHQPLSFEEFVKFYTHISMSIDDDHFFEQMITNVWNLDRQNTGYQQQYQSRLMN